MSLLSFEYSDRKRTFESAVPVLCLEALSVRLGQRLVLNNINLNLYEGEHVRIAGPNGAGKSTLLNAVMGLAPLAAGRVFYKGEDITLLPSHERARLGIRYMRQRDNVFPALSVAENLRLALGADGYERFCDTYEDWARDIPPRVSAGMLSGGQKQKLAWVMTTLSPHYLLLADEPTAGVSNPTEMPWGRDSTVVWVTHQ